MRINFKLQNTNFPLRDAGFTLIELIVVIAIIALLSGISVFALNEARESGRDAKRRGDLAQIAQGIELFKADCNFYPNSIPLPNAALTGVSPCNPTTTNRYIEAMPDDPNDTANNYGYSPLPAGCTASGTCTRFQLWASLENPPTPLPGYCNANPGTCGGTCNFCIINP
jgi:general secretion pathway protein G